MTTATATILAAHMGGSPALALIVLVFIVACLATGPATDKDQQ